MIEEIIKPVLPKEMMGRKVGYLVNPTGRFVMGGPQGDCGLTGRKIIVDVRRLGTARRRRVLRQGSVEGRPLGRLRGALCREEHRGLGPGDQGAGAGVVRDRRVEADQHHGHDVRHRQDLRRSSRTGRETFRPAAQGIIQMLDLLRRFMRRPRLMATSAVRSRNSPGKKPTRPTRSRQMPA